MREKTAGMFIRCDYFCLFVSFLALTIFISISKAKKKHDSAIIFRKYENNPKEEEEVEVPTTYPDTKRKRHAAPIGLSKA